MYGILDECPPIDAVDADGGYDRRRVDAGLGRWVDARLVERRLDGEVVDGLANVLHECLRAFDERGVLGLTGGELRQPLRTAEGLGRQQLPAEHDGEIDAHRRRGRTALGGRALVGILRQGRRRQGERQQGRDHGHDGPGAAGTAVAMGSSGVQATTSKDDRPFTADRHARATA